MSWVSLHNHTQYSILDSSCSVKGLVAKAVECNMKALAITDFCNMHGVIEFYKACVSSGIKPILGSEVVLAPGSRLEKKKIFGKRVGYNMVLLAKDKKGYQNLCKISSVGYVEGFYYTPRIDREFLSEHAEGLICITGSVHTLLGDCIVQENEEDIQSEISYLKNLFGVDLYFELQRHEMDDASLESGGMKNELWLHQKYKDYIEKQRSINKNLLRLSEMHDIKTLATNDVHYLEKKDWKAHEILMNIQSGEPCEIWEKDSYGSAKGKILNPKRKVIPTHELYFKSAQEMESLFSDCAQALETPSEIVEKCSLEIDFETKFYPVFTPPDFEGKEIAEEVRIRESENYLCRLCAEGIEKRYTKERLAKVQEKYPEQNPREVVENRLKMELEIITSKGMCDYLLIVHDFIFWAKEQGIPVGPGRGSGAGSIILYLIGITDIEPLRFNLFFERFINPERISYPDIDVDICMERRSDVIEYTLNKYGKDKVAQIITFGTMKAKMAIKDVGRVLSIPLSKVNALAKLVPEDLGITLSKALEMDKEFESMYQNDEDAKQIIDYALILEGSIRNTGIHAAGLIICGDPLTDHIPVCNPKESEIMATQYSMKPVEQVGMLKIDFLGLKTLTTIQKAATLVKKRENIAIDWVNLPFNDKPTFDLLNQGKTLGIFQLESAGMQDLARQLHIDKFEEIIAVGALYRPGPMEMIPSFIKRKHGKEEIEIDHPLMEDIIEETYGIMVYQEQVMQIASRLANFSLGEGDVLRRAMGKKDKEEMARQGEKFKIGALKNGIPEETSMAIFHKIEKFASYGFNKSHAAAYGYLSYVTAYFKANYPKEWLAALMSCDMDDVTKVAKHIREAQSMNIEILTPDVNESDVEFVATNAGIRFAMSAIRGVGRGVVEEIVAKREENGPYLSLNDFFKRVDNSKVGKKVTETLIDAGAFDFTGQNRISLLKHVEPLFANAMREQKEKEKGIIDIFSFLEEEEEENLIPTDESVNIEIPKQEKLRREKELLGVYLTGHPMEEFKELITKLCCVPLSEIETLSNNALIRVGCIIEDVRTRITSKSQRKFAIIVISDGVDRFELPIWPALFEEKHPILCENQLIYALLQVEKDGNDVKLQCRFIDDLTIADEKMIAECDLAYDKAKNYLRLDALKEKKRSEVKKEGEKAKMQTIKKKEVAITIDLEKIKMSDILLLKKEFTGSYGDDTLQLLFTKKAKKLGALAIDGKFAVSASDEFIERINKYPFVLGSAIV